MSNTFFFSIMVCFLFSPFFQVYLNWRWLQVLIFVLLLRYIKTLVWANTFSFFGSEADFVFDFRESLDVIISQIVRIHTSSNINIENILNRTITKFYNSDDVNWLRQSYGSLKRGQLFLINIKDRSVCMAYCKLQYTF